MEGKQLVLRSRRVITGVAGEVMGNVDVVIEGDRIAEIRQRDGEKGEAGRGRADAGSRIIDLGERTLLPGIVDAHMHFFGVPSIELYRLQTEEEAYRALRAAGEAKRILEAGITTVRCLGSSISPMLARAVEEGHVAGPRVVAAGEFVCATGGTWDPHDVPFDVANRTDMMADGADGVRSLVRRRIRNGSHVIKLGLSKGYPGDHLFAWGDDPLRQNAAFTEGEVRAAVEEAHSNGVRVSAHCIGDPAVRLALATGIDTIEHGYGIKDDTRQELAERGVTVVSTASQVWFHIQAQESYHYPAWQGEVMKRHFAQMRTDFEKGLAAGIRYVLGSDLIGYPTHPQDSAPKEFELVVGWGMAPMDAICAGTSGAANAVGLGEQIGSVAVGKLADLVATKDNPLEDISSLQRIDFVMKGGVVVRDWPAGDYVSSVSGEHLTA